MNPTTIQPLITVIMFVLFIGIVLWAWSDKRHRAFNAAARLPFAEDVAVGEREKRQ